MFLSSLTSTWLVIPMQKISTPAAFVAFASGCVVSVARLAFPSVIRKAIFFMSLRAPILAVVNSVRTSLRALPMFVSPPLICMALMADSRASLVVYWFRLNKMREALLNITTPILVKSAPIGKDRTIFFVKFLIFSKLV